MGAQGTDTSRSFTNLALAKNRDIRARLGKQNLGYSGIQTSTSQSKGNLPCVSEKSSTSSGVGKYTTGGLIAKIERGEVLTCIQPGCRTKVTKVFKYKCQNCNLDNLGTLYKRKLSAQAVFEVPNALYNTVEYQPDNKNKSKKK